MRKCRKIKIRKKYHIDYIFSSLNIIKNGFNLTIGNPKNWINLSDHVPLILDINQPSTKNNDQYSTKEFILNKFENLDENIQIKYQNEIHQIIQNLNHQLTTEQINLIYYKYNLLKEIENLSIKLSNNE